MIRSETVYETSVMVRGTNRGRESQTKGETFTAGPAPSTVSGEQGIIEMYKCKREGD